MIKLYTWTTPNGRKPAILLEELGIPYEVHPVNLGKGEQKQPEYLRISPNNKIPAIVDDEVMDGDKPLAVFESGAVLTYLADKTGRFLAPSGPARYQTFEWLHWQVGGLGPMLGQLGFFAVMAPEKSTLAIGRFTDEADRLLGVMDRRLSEAQYLAGSEYTIADISAYPWTLAATTFLAEPLRESLASKDSIKRWLAEVGARPAVVRGMQIPKG